ncbi:MAG: aminotransferase class I/II-fold pyridoxal phosphate-dependent enzyme [Candidatus Aenigmarchaeota archaeon]|nr:aminotransferase class I/II-fold pyridoxal phosphate-dependent enzyme [Candidatus Aenigmarchaeota archaeon]
MEIQNKMQAIILAAGNGKRLFPLTNDTPKVMIEVCGESIIKRALNNLAELNKIYEVIIVIGYKAEKIKEHIGTSYRGMKITYVLNKDYASTNNIYSLWLAKDYIKDDVILLEGDVIFEKELLMPHMNSNRPSLSLVAKYNENITGTVITTDEETKRINSFIGSKNQEQKKDYFDDKYKTINIYLFKKEFLDKYFMPSLDNHISIHGKNDYYEVVLGALAYIGVELHFHLVEDVNWYEIDDVNDLEKASMMFSKNEYLENIENRYGGYWNYDFVDFCYLYNLYFPNKELYESLQNKLPKLINYYPSTQVEIAKLLSGWFKDDFEHTDLIVGNGASELIRLINLRLIKKITIPVPSFDEYFGQLKENQINFFLLDKKKDFKIDVVKLVDSVKSSNSNSVLLINPNNPTSQILDNDNIRYVLENVGSEVLVFVDESFIDFANNKEKYSCQKLIAEFSNLVIIRSISKEFGVPGIRLGYILTKNELVKEEIKKGLPIWNINSVAEMFIELFTRYNSFYESSMNKIVSDRDYLTKKLENINFLKIYKPWANFILCELVTDKIDSKGLTTELFNEYNLLIKGFKIKKGLEDGKFIRISVRTKEDTDKLVVALEEIEGKL